MNADASKQGFGRESRLRSRDDFRRVFARKRSVADHLLVVYGCENECGRARLGLSVSRKVGNAVRRNRWKRLCREAFRHSQDKLPGNLDLVVIPRRGAEPEFASIERSLVALAARLQRRLR